MKKILLIISPQRESQKALKYCFNKAVKENLSIELNYIIDEKLTGSLESCLSELGFVGEKPGDDLMNVLNQEYIKRGEEKIKEIESLAKEENLFFTGEVIKGNYLNEIIKRAVKKDVVFIVLTEKRNSLLKKIFFSETKQLAKQIVKPIESFVSDL